MSRASRFVAQLEAAQAVLSAIQTEQWPKRFEHESGEPAVSVARNGDCQLHTGLLPAAKVPELLVYLIDTFTDGVALVRLDEPGVYSKRPDPSRGAADRKDKP